MVRREGLPEFASPPIKEVAFSIQFERPNNFNQMLVRDVWEIFRQEYPESRIEPRLAPVFETFSGAHRDTRKSNIKFEAHSGPIENRCIFFSPSKNGVIQFQSDRISLNWKEDSGREYPRFQSISAQFRSVFESLQKFFSENDWGAIEPNQCELVYSNVIPFDDVVDASSLLKVNTLSELTDVEGFQLHFTQQIKSENEAYARIYMNAWSTLDASNNPYLLANITVRGRPLDETLDASWDFFDRAHILIVEMFTQITSEEAHKKWERTT